MRVRALFLLFTIGIAFGAWPQTVVQRARLGYAIEDLDTVDKRLAVLDGYEVFLVDSKGRGEKRFDVRGGGAGPATGLTYVPTEKAFLVVDPQQRDRFFVFDDKGTPLGTRTITYLDGFMPTHIEALTYLGKGTPYPDHVAFLAWDDTAEWIEVARRDGTVVLHIVLPPLLQDVVWGMASNDGGGFHVIALNTEIYTVDYDGQIVAGPVRIHEGFIYEGITTIGNQVYARDYFSGKTVSFDASLQRQPANDLHDEPRPGLPSPRAVTWNSDADRHLVLAGAATEAPLFAMAWQVVSSLDEARPMFFPPGNGFLRPRAMSWMPDEHKIAVAHTQPQRAILIYSPSGGFLEQIDLTPIGRPIQLAWIPSTQEFYVRTMEMPATLRVLSRTGAFIRDVDFSALGLNIGPFTNAGDELLIFAGTMLYRTSLDGVVVASYDTASLHVQPASISAITTGPQAGMFAVTSTRDCELVVFSLP